MVALRLWCYCPSPRNAKDHFCKLCKPDEIFGGVAEVGCECEGEGRLTVSLSLLSTDTGLSLC